MKVKFVDSKITAFLKISALKAEEFIFSMLTRLLFVSFALKEDIKSAFKFIIVDKIVLLINVINK